MGLRFKFNLVLLGVFLAGFGVTGDISHDLLHRQARDRVRGEARLVMEAALLGGYTLNEYRFERVLGGGGFGMTYLAHDTNLDCRVAIKEYLPRDVAVRTPELSVWPRSAEAGKTFDWGLQRFLLESRALASFHHAGIVRVLRYFRANDTAYMVMEYETGQPLQQWLVGRLPLDRASLLRIIRPLLDGLEVVPGAGFLHRDVKPGNISTATAGRGHGPTSTRWPA